ncbi:MAG TPA: DUF6134 family protein [Dongiaceae bacterium]|nr:DUF6134 family protein [Dongiaceae bacterium]
MLRHWVQVTSALALCSAAGLAAADSPPPAVDPFRLYGNEVVFDVERDGDVVGKYVINFTRTDQGVLADARVDVDVNLLFVSVYKLRYHARELWSDGALQSIEAFTNDDGDLIHVQATRESEGLQVKTNDGAYETPAVLPISHWNAALLDGGPLLNGMTGEVDEVQVFDQGLDTVSTRGGSLRARHYLYSGDLNGEIWYDEDGRWVKLRFRAKDGSIIDYVCRQCQAPTTITEAD